MSGVLSHGSLFLRLLLLFCVTASVTHVTVHHVYAQEEGAAAAEGEGGEAAGPEKKSTLWWLIETSGWIGLLLLIISIYFVSKIMSLFLEFRAENIAPPDLIADIEEPLNKRDYTKVFQLAKESESELGQLIATGMTALSSGISDAREAMDRLGEAMTVEMEKKVSMLAVIGSLGPMIGLLGTLKGMIASFSVIATSDQALKPAEVAGGISEALLLTFEGVALSVPAIYFFAFFKNRGASLGVQAQNTAHELVRRIHASAHTRTAPAPAKATT